MGDPATTGHLESGDDPKETGTKEIKTVDTEEPNR